LGFDTGERKEMQNAAPPAANPRPNPIGGEVHRPPIRQLLCQQTFTSDHFSKHPNFEAGVMERTGNREQTDATRLPKTLCKYGCVQI
jgi:hypothetical protein